MDAINKAQSPTQGLAPVNQNARSTVAKDADESKHEEIVAVAKKFEALMLHAMLKSMRSTIVEDELTGSNGQDLYRDMMDQEIAKNISESGGFGIQDVLARQLGSNMGVDPTIQAASTGDAPVNAAVDRTSIHNASVDNASVNARLSHLQKYQNISGANDLMFNSQSSLMQD